MSANAELAAIFEQMAQLLELLGEDRFRVNAHAKAGRTIGDLGEDVCALADDTKKLTALDGIGAKTAEKIVEFCETGEVSEHRELLGKVPHGLLAVLAVPGLGPKTVKMMWDEKGVESVEDLKRIIEDGSILELPRMGAKAVEKIKKNLAFAGEAGKRMPLGIATPIAESIVEHMRRVKGVKQAAFAGSLRRGRDTIGDIDVLVVADDVAAAHEAFRSMDGVVDVIAAGESKSSVRLRTNLDAGRWKGVLGDETPTVQVDLRVVPAESWGAALMYFTGSKEHNVRLRERALKRGVTLNEYGLYPEDGEDSPPQSRGVEAVAQESEEAIYAALGVRFVPAELREDRGEIDAFDEGADEAAELVTVGAIRAELHAHTTASDGLLELEELVAGAKKRNFHTIAVTDHSRSSAIAGGLSVERLLEQGETIRAFNAKTKGITVLAGSEVDILADGTLDYPDEVLDQLDVVVASPHVALSQDPETATKRLVRAIENGRVNVLGHPTGRLIGRRAGTEPEMQRVIDAAIAHGTALEINAHWLRLDLRDTHVRAAVDAGALVAIDCDVHAAEDFENIRYGVQTGRRGWLPAELCVNTWSATKLKVWLQKG